MLPWLHQPETRPVAIVNECCHGYRPKVWEYHLGFIQRHDMLLFFWSVCHSYRTQGVGVVPLGKLLGVAIVPECHCGFWLLPWLQTRGVGVPPGLHPETQPGG